MPVFGTQMFGSGTKDAYEIDYSCCFNDDDTASLSRTPSSGGDRKTWTISLWAKFSVDAGSGSALFGSGASSAEDAFAYIQSGGALDWIIRDSSTLRGRIITNRLFRDPLAWYHFVFRVDTTDGTAGDRMRLFVNGVEETSFATDTQPAEDTESTINKVSTAQYIGLSRTDGGSNLWDGYLADVYLIDGTALTASSFGETNDEGVWVPKAYSGSYGTNGIRLKFQDSSALGDDTSGNGNDYTSNNLAATDQVTDTPTNNHCTWNAVFPNDSNIILSEGNRNFSHTGGDQRKTLGTMFPTSGKWYWEVKFVSGTSGGEIGISQIDVISQFDMGDGRGDRTGKGLGYRFWDGRTYYLDSLAAYGDALTAGDTGSVAWDVDNGKVYFAKNGTWQNSGDPTSGATGTGAFGTTLSSAIIDGGPWGPAACNEGSNLYEAHFAEAEWTQFSGAAPTGYTALSTANMATPALKDPSTNFQTQLYTGNGSTQSITFGGNSNMQPDIVLLKDRAGNSHNTILFDAARGVQKYLQTATDAVEATDSSTLTAFNSDGFSLSTAEWVNQDTVAFVSWNWAAGNSGSSNTAGTINTTTTYSDATSGISVSTYEGTGSAATIGHGLGVAPKFIIVKNRDAADDWKVYHVAVASDPQTDYLVMNTNAAAVDDSTVWNDTAPTSTVFSIGTHTDVNTSGESYVAYAFAEVAGFSKFGVYTGNENADGPMVSMDFKAALFVSKRVDSTSDWIVWDNKRSTYNVNSERLIWNSDGAEGSANLDFLSNGVKIRNDDSSRNASGGIYIVMAWAQNPFGGEDVSPATAR